MDVLKSKWTVIKWFKKTVHFYQKVGPISGFDRVRERHRANVTKGFSYSCLYFIPFDDISNVKLILRQKRFRWISEVVTDCNVTRVSGIEIDIFNPLVMLRLFNARRIRLSDVNFSS